MNIRQDLYHYKRNKRKQRELEEKIELLRAKAEKVTPTYSDDKSGFTNEVRSKVEDNAIKIVELEDQLKITSLYVKNASDFLDSLKPYRRNIVRSCIVDHIPYSTVAKREKTTVQNIAKIVNKAIKEKPLE